MTEKCIMKPEHHRHSALSTFCHSHFYCNWMGIQCDYNLFLFLGNLMSPVGKPVICSTRHFLAKSNSNTRAAASRLILIVNGLGTGRGEVSSTLGTLVAAWSHTTSDARLANHTTRTWGTDILGWVTEGVEIGQVLTKIPGRAGTLGENTRESARAGR